MRLSEPINPSWMTPRSGLSIRWLTIESGAKRIYPHGLAMAAFEYRQAEEIRDVFARFGVRYLFIGKSGAIILGFPDVTQDADLFVEKNTANSDAAISALGELQFKLTDSDIQEIK